MYVMQAADDLAVYGINETSSEWSTLSRLDQLVQITLHTLKDKVQLLGRWEKKRVIKGDDVGMGWDGT